MAKPNTASLSISLLFLCVCACVFNLFKFMKNENGNEILNDILEFFFETPTMSSKQQLKPYSNETTN